MSADLAFWIGLIVLEVLIIAIVAMLLSRRWEERVDQLIEQNTALSKEVLNLHHQSERAERFKKKCLQLTDENIALTRALESTTIHQPPPTLGE